MSKDKISSQEIIDLLASKASVSKRAAEEFLKMMIASIEDALVAGDHVKIKGFGTFKLVWNEPRKSVNVSTGEEILLDGFHKVSFLPENSLKELVNEPYAHLESVEIDDENNFVIPEKQDEVPLDPMRIFTEQASEIKDILSEIQAISTPKVELKEEKVENIVVVENLVIEEVIETTTKIQIPDYVFEDEVVKFEKIENEEVVVTEVVEYIDSVQRVTEVVETKIAFEATAIESETVENNSVPEVSPFLTNVKPLKKRKRWIWISILAIIVSGIIGLCFYNAPVNEYGKKLITQAKTKITYLKENISMTEMANSVSKWFDPKSDEKLPIIETIVVPKDTIVVDTVYTNESVDSLQLLFDNPRIYTEFIASEQIKHGSRLTIMAKRYYGSKDFWVYIYEANKERIQNPDKIEIGTLIRIPKLDPRLIDVSNPRCMQKACQLHDIYVNSKPKR